MKFQLFDKKTAIILSITILINLFWALLLILSAKFPNEAAHWEQSIRNLVNSDSLHLSQLYDDLIVNKLNIKGYNFQLC